MRRPFKSNAQKRSVDSQRLTMLAQAIDQSASRLEERNWENQLDSLLRKLMKNDHQDIIDAALDHAFKLESSAYDALMECAEAASESCQIEQDGIQYDALLIAAPILAWTRFSIAAGAIPAEAHASLSAHLYAHVLAPNVKMAMAPMLFSIDQLPRSHTDAFALTQRLALSALKGSPVKAAPQQPETAPFLADTRYLVAAVTAVAGEPLFRWQELPDPIARDQALSHWNAQAMPTIARLLPGCGVELLLPEAYFAACREGDRQIRPASIRAAVHYLTHTMSVEPDALQAIVGGFGEEANGGRVDEYRISFTLLKDQDVIYGIVWPLYGPEDGEELPYRAVDLTADPLLASEVDRKSPLEEIFALLEECGVPNVKHHIEHFAMEFCDDCGSPLFPDMDGELVHAEMPEDAPTGSGHLH
ncbi:MAG TPA: DUF2863 family protein [Herminiimonas sp.]|nr:DUF2863 family protein [Herminiimonas sp.]